MGVLPFVIIMVIAGSVAVAWQIWDARDKDSKWLKRKAVHSERAEKRQMHIPKERVHKSQVQISIERIEKKEVEISKTLDQVLNIISKENNQKPARKKGQKTDTRKQKKKKV
jgi:hypothetical protein